MAADRRGGFQGYFRRASGEVATQPVAASTLHIRLSVGRESQEMPVHFSLTIVTDYATLESISLP